MPLGFYSIATIVGLGPYYSRYPRQDTNGIGNSTAGLVPLRVLLGGGRGWVFWGEFRALEGLAEYRLLALVLYWVFGLVFCLLRGREGATIAVATRNRRARPQSGD